LSNHECPFREQIHKGFRITKRNCAHGVHGNISIIKNKSDGNEYIWKRPVGNKSIHIKSFKKEIEKAKYWRKIGVSKVKICWHTDNKSIVKTLVRGPTLKQMLHEHKHFFSNTHDDAYKELGRFVRCLVTNRRYIQDCNRSNLVYDKGDCKWNLIDSSNIQKKSSRHEIADKFKRTFIRSWGSSLESHKEKEALEKFLNKYCR
jgi:tRNA A-37 threonylcarbamoyl transferase component Bud32